MPATACVGLRGCFSPHLLLRQKWAKILKKIYICTNKAVAIGRPSCGLRGSEKTMAFLKEELAKRGVAVQLESITCLGHCNEGPSLRLAGGNFFLGADPDKIQEIADWVEQELATEKSIKEG